jgi:hypothetical protein
MRGVVVGSTLPSYIHDRFSLLPCTGGIFRGECVSRETWYGGHIKINLVIYGEAVYLWGGGWVRRMIHPTDR